MELDANPSTNKQVTISEHSRQSSINTKNTAQKCQKKVQPKQFMDVQKNLQVPFTNISLCTTLPYDDASNKHNPDRNKKKGPENIHEAELNNFIEINSKGKSRVKCPHNKIKLSPTFLKKTQEQKQTVKRL